MTPVQMVTGCDHVESPVPIHLPVNSSFDTYSFVHAVPHMTAAILHTTQGIEEYAPFFFFVPKLQNITPNVDGTFAQELLKVCHEYISLL